LLYPVKTPKTRLAFARSLCGFDFPPLKEAETLAKTADLKEAREAFKPLSASLIKYLAENKAGKGICHETYCPMVKASWLQAGKDIKNPYMGKAMLACGELKS
jgi:hypothetical protein